MVIHCLFEQSGTFKKEFIKLGYQAFDYDILNDFNQTDYIIDLFSEIENAYLNKLSIFDNINKEDLILAFFPCVRFSNQAYMMFQCTQKQLKDLSNFDKLQKVMKFHNELAFYYDMLCKLFCVCIQRDFKLIVENPYSREHYLTRYFPIKSTIIDLDRTKRGDCFKKPTQYWFVNCSPKFNFEFGSDLFSTDIHCTISYTSSQVERSLISSVYANRFIKEFIL